MTREEAAEFTRKLVARAETIVFPKTVKTINNIPVSYFEAVLAALREAMDRQEGCKHCSWIDTSRAHEDEDGPINYCRVCGRYLRNPGEAGTKIDQDLY